MWKHMARIIGEVRPHFVFVENSPMLVGRGLARVLGDLAAMGYGAKWGVVGAHHVSAPHKRDRIWIVAHPERWRLEGRDVRLAESSAVKPSKDSGSCRGLQQRRTWPPEPELGRVADGVACWMDRLRCIGNGQVPAVAALAWQILTDNAEGKPTWEEN
jgi:DNA (cytosine-5)-methyltransferase 1